MTHRTKRVNELRKGDTIYTDYGKRLEVWTAYDKGNALYMIQTKDGWIELPSYCNIRIGNKVK